MRARFEHEIRSLSKQKWLLDNVHYWFLGPIGIGALIQAVTHDSAEPVPWVYYGVCVVVLAVTYWLCRRESASKFGPLLTRMQALYRDLTAT